MVGHSGLREEFAVLMDISTSSRTILLCALLRVAHPVADRFGRTFMNNSTHWGSSDLSEVSGPCYNKAELVTELVTEYSSVGNSAPVLTEGRVSVSSVPGSSRSLGTGVSGRYRRRISPRSPLQVSQML